MEKNWKQTHYPKAVEGKAEFSWHYFKRAKTKIVIIWEGEKYEVSDIALFIDLRENPMHTSWHNGYPTLTCDGHADRMEIITRDDGTKVANVY